MPLITAQNLPGFRDFFELLCRVYPGNSGRAAGGGCYPYAAAVKVSAVPEQHYVFVNWTENGRILGTEPELSVQVTADCILTATFEPVQYEVAVRILPEEGGCVEGDGFYSYGAVAILAAVPAEGYAFSCWMENDSPLNEGTAEAEYAFVVEGSRALSACFKRISEADQPDEEGAGK